MDKESGVAKIAYEKLKEQVKDAANEIDGLKAELERRLERLTDLRASIVEDPDTCVAKLHELREVCLTCNRKSYIQRMSPAIKIASA